MNSMAIDGPDGLAETADSRRLSLCHRGELARSASWAQHEFGHALVEKGQRPAASSDCFLSHRSSCHAEVGLLLFPGVERGVADAELSVAVAEGMLLPADGRPKRSVPRRILTASSIYSFRRGPTSAAIILSYQSAVVVGETSEVAPAHRCMA